MATYYTKTYTYSGQTYSIRVDMRTSTRTEDNGAITPLNTVSVTNYNGVVTPPRTSVEDGQINGIIAGFSQQNIDAINGAASVPNSAVDKSLTADGFTRH